MTTLAITQVINKIAFQLKARPQRMGITLCTYNHDPINLIFDPGCKSGFGIRPDNTIQPAHDD